MRGGPFVILTGYLLTVACGGVSKRRDASRDSPSTDAGGACAEPTSAIPDAGVFVPPPSGPFGTFQVTFQNRCAVTVWPAWGSAGGLDQSVIDSELWLPLSPGSNRSVVVYNSVGEIGFWGRTACGFKDDGSGSCATGDCGGFVCPARVNEFPANATVFLLEGGFLGGYNVGLSVEGTTCGAHSCVADLGTCSDASAIEDSCGNTIACSNICGDSTAACCSQSSSGCGPRADNRADAEDLIVTFCPRT